MRNYKLNEIENKRILGRSTGDAGKSDKPLTLFWGAAALELNVKAKEVWIKVSSLYDTYEPWIAVEVNGFPTSRFMVHSGDAQWICVAANLNCDKENLITIYKDTQPMTGEAHHSLFIHEVGLSDEGCFCPLKSRKGKIEFVGDSITSGEGLAGGPDEGDWITQWFCASKTYAVQTAKALDYDWSVLSQCGWGICWGWDGNRNSVMPPHYNEVCSVMWGDYQNSLGADEKFDFKDGSDLVVINLGTNDNGAFSQAPWKDENGVEHVLSLDEKGKASEKDGQIIADTVGKFLTNVRKCNPRAKIIWVWGMITLNAAPDCIKAGIEKYKNESKDNKVYTLLLDSMEALEVNLDDKGSRGHPGPKTHKAAAEALVKFIKTLD